MARERILVGRGTLTTSTTTAYTVPTGKKLVINALHVENHDSSPRTARFFFDSGSGASTYAWLGVVPVDGNVMIPFLGLVLEAGWRFRVSASVSNNLDWFAAGTLYDV